MANTEWTMQGLEFANCNCNTGCPCQFNSLPTHGNCRAHTFFQIDHGRYGDVVLDGLRGGLMAMWPGPIHEGNGTWLSIIDKRANPAQRAALEAISHGKDTDPGGSIFQVFHTTVTKVLPTEYRQIDLDIDYVTRKATLRVLGLLESDGESIRNPVTNLPHQVRVTLPTGFEYTEAEFISGKAKTTAPIDLQFDGTHAHLAKFHWSTHGVVR